MIYSFSFADAIFSEIILPFSSQLDGIKMPFNEIFGWSVFNFHRLNTGIFKIHRR